MSVVRKLVSLLCFFFKDKMETCKKDKRQACKNLPYNLRPPYGKVTDKSLYVYPIVN